MSRWSEDEPTEEMWRAIVEDDELARWLSDMTPEEIEAEDRAQEERAARRAMLAGSFVTDRDCPL